MPSQLRTRTVLFVLGLIVIMGVIALILPEMVGWATAVLFSSMGLAFLFGYGGMVRRRTSVAFAAYMFACAAKFGTSFGDVALPRWGQFALTLLLLIAIVWFFFESRKDSAARVRDA